MPEEHFGMQRPNPSSDPSPETDRFISTQPLLHSPD